MLTKKSVEEFLDNVASNAPAPGGGSVSALAGALGAALTSMVARLTIGKKNYADVQEEMEDVLKKSEGLRAQITAVIDEDTLAFNKVMQAFGMPKESDDQKSARTAAIQEATRNATTVPLRLMELCVRSIDLAMGYFYPHGRMIRSLKRAVRRGVHVRLLVPMRTDIPVARWAARGLYGRLLRGGVEVWEYEPSMMHAKLVIADDTLICGSANLDIRSGRINYELVAVVKDSSLAARARADFAQDLASSVRIDIEEWRKRPFVQKLKERISYCVLARFDMLLARRNLRSRP